jgi:alpha 1,3-mannosyltransferase
MGMVKVRQWDKERKLGISANTKRAQKESKEKEARKAKEKLKAQAQVKEEKLKAQQQAKEIKAKLRNRPTRAGAKRKITATLPTPTAAPRKRVTKEQAVSGPKEGTTQETNRASKRLCDGEAQEDQGLPTNKKQKAPQELAKAEETVREGKEKEKGKEKGKDCPLPQANTNTMIRYLTIQANPEVSKLNQGK